MSVLKAKRGEGKFDILTKARDLCAYTVQICKNEKNFPKRDRWLITQPIVNEAVTILSCVRKANAVKVVYEDDYKFRRSQQVKAAASAEALLALIDVAYISLNIETRRIEYWTGLVVELEDKISNWRKSDSKRFKHLLGDVVEDFDK